MPIWLGFAWTLPNTLLGILLGLFTFQVPRLRHGLLLFDRRPRGVTQLMPRLGRTAMTVGFVVVSAAPVEGRLLVHERHHVRQYMSWGPLFIPVYLALGLAFGYRRHPMEVAAVCAADEVGGSVAG
ncbi:MAG TPA: hypothetical protein VFZ75_09665 [Actinomycetota bacterium]|nr:hypothetical protein [Actinomycetota bacterium]